jgi:ATP-dependent Lon protease
MNKDNLIEFAKEQCEIFPEDSYMGEYLRETIKMLQREPSESHDVSFNELEIIEKLVETKKLTDKQKEAIKSLLKYYYSRD